MRSGKLILLAAPVWAGLAFAAEPLKPVALDKVDITDEFWSPRLEINRTVSIEHCYRELQATGRFDDLRLIEAAGYMIEKRKDPKLEAFVDPIVDREIASAERRIGNPDQVVRISGYFYEAAVAWLHGTGKRKMF